MGRSRGDRESNPETACAAVAPCLRLDARHDTGGGDGTGDRVRPPTPARRFSTAQDRPGGGQVREGSPVRAARGDGSDWGEAAAMIDLEQEWETWRKWLGGEPKASNIYAEIVEMLSFRKMWQGLRSSTTRLRNWRGRTACSCGGFAGTTRGRWDRRSGGR